MYSAQYIIDLWNLERHQRLEIAALVTRAVRVVAIVVSNFPSLKLSNVMNLNGFDVSPPPIPPSRLELDEQDETMMTQLERILSMPHVRVAMPYVMWYSK